MPQYLQHNWGKSIILPQYYLARLQFWHLSSIRSVFATKNSPKHLCGCCWERFRRVLVM